MSKDYKGGITLGTALKLGSSLMALALPAMAVAQNEEGAAPDIVITGSRVRGEAPVGSTVTTLGRAEMEASSAVTVDRMIKEIPQVFDLGVSENSRGQSGGSGNITYGNSVNLRGIGPYATLVMIDGHRVTNNSRSIDPSVLPSLGVERVEVVADGASAIYGSDAVAGVVNLIPRRSLDGGEVFARSGISSRGDFHETTLGAALGKVFERGQIMVAYEHVERSNLSGDDRGFFTSNQTGFGGGDYRIVRCAPGNINANGTTYAIPAGGVTQATAGSLAAGTLNRCDELDNQDLIPEQRYDSFNSTGRFDLTDWLSVFYDGFYSKRNFYRNSAYSNARLTVPQTNAFFVRPAGFSGTSYTLDYNFGSSVPINDSFGSAESWQITPGLRAKLPHDWEAEVLFGYGKTNDFSGSYHGINNAALNAALASSNPATAFDPYSRGRTSAAVLAGISDQIFLAPTNGHLKTYEGRLNGSLFALPGGDVKLAAGYERQDFNVALGSARGGPTTPITYRHFGREVDSFYGELYIPIFGANNAVPGFERLELNAAVRHDKYSDVGSTTNPKFGLNWQPVRGVKLRGSYGTSFRAPTIPEIYGNSNNIFGQSYQNPAGGAPLQGYALSGPNLDLKPETATTWSVGLDFEPTSNLSLGVTYWDVKYENQVLANLSNLTILGNEAQYAGTGIILRGSAAAARVQQLLSQGVALAGGSFPGGDPANVTLFVDGRSQNLGVSITRGIDFSGTWKADIGAADHLLFNVSGTYLTKYNIAVTPAAPLVDRRNVIFNPLKFKARASITWDHGPLSARVLATHVGGYTNNLSNPVQSVKSYTPVDLTLTWRIGDPQATGFFEKGLTLAMEVRNVLDIAPPYVNLAPNGNGGGGYDATASDPIGRLFAVSVRKSF
ncbi:iron complex outermembrane receptor protein [Sphingobium sp. B1D7B]|uniref:TonB-dependent receptor plug domain-containing protein n=1 Tax=Sphingobium sp. B1D7B TaxID=2940578 RepID=UPI002223FEC2|nr:TonB-dependent receptor [Sphingobium sp. B1D7B]MCW2406515.1 iron complex outermembrane receptor protein [Sphingobium sp. B1D7B]